MTSGKYEAARRLYFEHDGSKFYMWKNGTDDEYERYHVPSTLEAAWLEELTQSKLEELDKPGNWWVVSFLVHHGDLRHLDRVIRTKPQGVMWEKCAFLELLLQLLERAVDKKQLSPANLTQALGNVQQHCAALLRRARAKASCDRIRAIVRKTEAMQP